MAKPIQTTLDGPTAYAQLMSWATLPDVRSMRLRGGEIRNGELMALVLAETLAVNFQLQPPVVVSEKGVSIPALGSARALVDRMPEDGQILYLGTHGAVRRLHLSVRYPFGFGPRPDWAPGMGVAWYAIGAVGLAALIAGTWYATKAKEAELAVEVEKARAAAAASAAVQLATPYIQAGQKVPDAIIDPLRRLASYEKVAGSSWITPAAIGVGVGLVGGAVALGKGGYLGKR